VAVVTPRAGYRFCASNQNGYTTYVLAIDRRSWRTLAQWALVLLLCATAVLLTSHVPGVEHSPFFVFLVISVLVSARMAGWAGGLIASAVNSAAAAYLLLPPLGSLLIANRNHAVQFVLTTLIMMAVGIYSGLAGRTCDLAGRLRQRP
jgi:K+-sensing histidine kinase KdpD